MEWAEIGLSAPSTGWGPRGPGQEIRDMVTASFNASQSVSYQVSLRWVFYRLWQAGDLAHIPATPSVSAKVNAYNRLKSVCSKAVHFGLLTPNWVADDTRGGSGGGGYQNVSDWVESLRDEACYLDRWVNQGQYVMVAFEAAAMSQQFEHYTSGYGCRLYPMRGDPSNPYKYRIALHINWIGRSYNIPVVILYFGDLDTKGLSIPEAAFRDIREWATHPFKVYRVGLNPGDEVRFSLPDIPGKPGSYQWEALEDEHAEELITGSLGEFMDDGLLSDTVEREEEATERMQRAISEMLEEYDE